MWPCARRPEISINLASKAISESVYGVLVVHPRVDNHFTRRVVAEEQTVPLEKYFRIYNQERPHASLDDKTPDGFYFNNLPAMPKAA